MNYQERFYPFRAGDAGGDLESQMLAQMGLPCGFETTHVILISIESVF
jgi:hypothetical protein